MRIILLVLSFLLLFFGAGPVFAVSVTISNTPAGVTDQPFSIDVAVSGAQPGTNYLRANLFPTGTTKYFGFTYNGSDFVNVSDYSQYFPITIDSSGSWTGSLQGKLDPDSGYFSGPGSYSLKVRRYTQSGSSYTWSNEVTLNVEFAGPTPTPTIVPEPTQTPQPPPAPTATTSSSKTKSTSNGVSSPTTKTSTALPSVNNQVIPAISDSTVKPQYQTASVAAMAASATASTTEVRASQQINLLPIIGGILILTGISSVILIYFRSRKSI